MRLTHFEMFKPVCPRCRAGQYQPAPLVISKVVRGNDQVIFEGALTCTHPHCGVTYPIVDGIPIIMADLSKYLSDALYAVTLRDDLSAVVEAIVGEAVGPGAAFNTNRHYLGTYGWDHYGDLAPENIAADTARNWRPGSIVSCLSTGLDLFTSTNNGGIEGPILDVGCAAGRSTFELANRSGSFVLGVDVNFLAGRLAQRVMHEGRVIYPLKQIGIVYERRDYAVKFAHTERVDFWACDGLSLPFRNGTFGFVNALNVLDQVSSPLQLLTAISDVLRPHGKALLATPYDWSGAIPMKNWLGGRSSFDEDRADSAAALRSLLSSKSLHATQQRLRLIGEVEHHPWEVRVHNRRTAAYDTHIVACIAASSTTPL